MGFEDISGVLDDLIEKAGGCAVIDGGFATQLELHGASISLDHVWGHFILLLFQKLESYPFCETKN